MNLAFIFLLCALPILLLLGSLISRTRKKTVQSIINRAVSLEGKEYINLKDVKISYWLSNGSRHYPSINNTGDVIIFSDFILVTRKQWFLFSSWLKPLIISYRNWSQQLGDSVETPIPLKFTYWEQRRNEVQIQLAFREYNHLSAVLSLKALNVEQINELKSFEKRIMPIDFKA